MDLQTDDFDRSTNAVYYLIAILILVGIVPVVVHRMHYHSKPLKMEIEATNELNLKEDEWMTMTHTMESYTGLYIPSFLSVKYGIDFRAELKIAEGGGGVVEIGTLTHADITKRNDGNNKCHQNIKEGNWKRFGWNVPRTINYVVIPKREKIRHHPSDTDEFP